MAKKIFEPVSTEQGMCEHKNIKLVDVQEVGGFKSIDYECAICETRIQTDGKDPLDAQKKKDVDANIKDKKEKGTLSQKVGKEK